MKSENVRDKSGYEDNRQNNPVATNTVIENVARRNCSNKRTIEPEEHSQPIGRPEVLFHPLNKATIEKCFIKNMNNISGEKYPEKDAQE